MLPAIEALLQETGAVAGVAGKRGGVASSLFNRPRLASGASGEGTIPPNHRYARPHSCLGSCRVALPVVTSVLVKKFDHTLIEVIACANDP
jgi:hypothetical protein